MKILMVIDAWFPHMGGGQVHVWELSKAIADQNNEVTILTRNLGRWSEKYPGVKVIKLGGIKKFSNLIGRLEFLVYSLGHILTNSYDLYHLHAFSPGLLAPFIRLLKRRPVVFTMHGEGMKIAGLPFGEKLLQDLVFYKIKYDLQITVAKDTIKGKVKSKKVAVIPNGINLPEFKKAQRERKKISHLLYVGRLSFDKGVDILINAFELLDDNNLTLTVVGDGPEMSNLKAKVKSKKITFKGKMIGDKLISEIKKADLQIMPSRVEGMPIRLLEAWASKIPILVTDVSDNKVYVKDNVNGFLVKPDATQMKKKLQEIVNMKNLDRITQNGYDQGRLYSWQKIADQTLKEYRTILQYEKT